MVLNPARSRLVLSRRHTRRARGGLLRRLVGAFAFGFGGTAVARLILQLTEGPGNRRFIDRLDLERPLEIGIGFGAVMAISVLAAAWFEQPTDLTKMVRTGDALQRDRRVAIFRMVIIGLGVGGLEYTMNPYDVLRLAVPVGTACALGYGLGATAWGQWLIFGRLWLPLTGRLPWAVMTFLDEARQHGVLRQTGAAYQFRHSRLRDALVEQYQRTD